MFGLSCRCDDEQPELISKLPSASGIEAWLGMPGTPQQLSSYALSNYMTKISTLQAARTSPQRIFGLYIAESCGPPARRTSWAE